VGLSELVASYGYPERGLTRRPQQRRITVESRCLWAPPRCGRTSAIKNESAKPFILRDQISRRGPGRPKRGNGQLRVLHRGDAFGSHRAGDQRRGTPIAGASSLDPR